MSYTITKTDGTTITQIVDGSLDQTSTDLTLIGKNLAGYGIFINENLVKLLENFASTSQPSYPLTGQLWFDTTENRLKVYDGSNFKVSGGTIVSQTPPSSISAGDMWIDSARQQLYFNDGLSTKLAGPIYTATQGITGFNVEEIVDTVGVSHTILKLYVAQSLIGIFSKDSFTPGSTIAGFLGAVSTGFNVSTLSGVKFSVASSQSDSLLAADGTPRTAANFLSTLDDSATTGTISIQNAVPLVLGEGASTEINATTSIFQFKSNTSNQNFGVNLLSGSGLATAFFINATTQRMGVYTELPTATLDVNGDARIRGSLTVEGNVTSVNTTNVEIVDKLIELAKVVSPSNATANGGGISIEGGTDGDKTLTWTTTGSTWSSSENFNLAINKAYKINGFDVLSQTSLGTTVASAPGLTSVGTLTSLQVSNLSVNGTTISSTLVNSNIILSPNGSGTISMNNAKISNLATPTDPAHGANKSYVDYTVRFASLGLSADTTGLTPPQINSEILIKIFPWQDHEASTKLRLICTDKAASGYDQGSSYNSRYKLFVLTATGIGDAKIWQYGGPIYEIWDSGTSYVSGNVVSYLTGSYISILASLNQIPSSSPTYWTPLA
jgi:hypothetical protein